jgi:hypothetical protein
LSWHSQQPQQQPSHNPIAHSTLPPNVTLRFVQVKDVVAWLDGVFADEYLPNDLDEEKRSRILQWVSLLVFHS